MWFPFLEVARDYFDTFYFIRNLLKYLALHTYFDSTSYLQQLKSTNYFVSHCVPFVLNLKNGSCLDCNYKALARHLTN